VLYERRIQAVTFEGHGRTCKVTLLPSLHGRQAGAAAELARDDQHAGH
jgi:hypothetical protein